MSCHSDTRVLRLLLLLTVLACAPTSGGAQSVTYDEGGLRIATPGGGTTATVGFRNQVRFTTPFAVVPTAPDQIPAVRSDDFRLFRSRFRLNGQLFSPRLRYQFQADFIEERVRDLSVTWEVRPWLRVRGGRWKAEMNRERLNSSSAQQLVDRSILDRWFTLGRQQGVQLSGTVGRKRPWGGTWYASALRGVDAKGGAPLPVWLGRYEWAYAGRTIDLEQGDLRRSPEVRVVIGGTAVRTESAYAFYGGSGVGVSLPLLPPGPGDRFRTRQYALDGVARWRGLSLQGELHRKVVRRTASGDTRVLVGGYGQAGVMAATLWERLPSSLEVATRIALVDPDAALDANHQEERLVGANWFFRGHRMKISADVGQLRFATPTGVRETAVRTRVQWEMTF
jgi:phosphate-selective porin OprO/OprP